MRASVGHDQRAQNHGIDPHIEFREPGRRPRPVRIAIATSPETRREYHSSERRPPARCGTVSRCDRTSDDSATRPGVATMVERSSQPGRPLRRGRGAPARPACRRSLTFSGQVRLMRWRDRHRIEAIRREAPRGVAHYLDVAWRERDNRVMSAAQFAGMSSGAPSDEVRRILVRCRRIAVVGLSPNPARPSYRAMVHMRASGYEIIPVNPTAAEVFGIPSAPTLADAAARGPLEIVDIFRRPKRSPPLSMRRLSWVHG